MISGFIYLGLCISPTIPEMHPLIVLFLFLLPPSSAITDENSLIDFKNSITSDPLNSLANWLPTLHFCNWTGVTCNSARNRVQLLQLADMQLEGSISPSIGNLSFLTQLDLINNSFVGQIPQEIERIQGLKALYLSINLLHGSIPRSLSSCKELRELNLAANQLTGTIPAELGLLSNLRVLKLGENNLSGSIPPSLGNLSYLEALSMEDLDLEGHIPPELGMLSSLTSFILFENPRLTGPIPSSISNNSGLVELALYSNNLTGTIPPELGKLLRLRVLYLWDNQLRGTIPASIANCTQLSELDLELNHLTGEVPLALSRLSKLQTLSLSSNQLVSGSSVTIPILSALRNCTVLDALLIHDNYLTGYLPEQLPQNLTLLSLYQNNITGIVPSLIANITNLRDLDLSSNLLTGHIPSSLRSLGNLQRLLLDNNKIEGNIPSEIGEIKSLGKLSVSHNMLSGEIPATIGGLQQLTHLQLNHNNLTGNIPASLGKCYNLQLLDLSTNHFTGRIPHEVTSLANLQFYFNLSRNSLEGSLPLEFGKMIHVQAIDVSDNRLQGTVPGTLGSCEQLEYLNLSSNELQGPIPNSLSGLKSIVSMDLSLNNLSGLIPVSLFTSLDMLQYLNLSLNNFSGEVPKEGIFTNLTAASFKGNMGLCGEWIQLPACSVLNTRSKDHTKRNRILASVCGTIGFLLVCLLILGLIYRRRQDNSESHRDILPLKLMENRGISYQEIVKATDGFHEKNLLGTGSFGSVYKGIMDDGKVAAFKLLNLQNEEASKSFSKECKVLSEVRHRNLVKIISFCLEFGHKVLVLDFMSNGNLDTLLHSKNNPLTFWETLNVAIDVIHGLEYLHHDCFLQVVHCDIKPSNILLDEDMTAHVADFGIAQIICGSDISIESGSTSTLALKGSMGYIAPEYGVGGKVSTRGDIYSYGIMLLEMITGESPTNHIFVGGLNLRKWVNMHFDNKLEEIVDMRIMEEIGENGINQCLIPLLLVGLECSKESASERPTAREVVGVLSTIRDTLLEPH